MSDNEHNSEDNPYTQLPSLQDAQQAAMESAQEVLRMLGFEVHRMALVVSFTHPAVSPPPGTPEDAHLNLACFYPLDDSDGHIGLMTEATEVAVKSAEFATRLSPEMPEGTDPDAD